MNTKIAMAAFAAASLSVLPAFAQDAAATTTTTTTTEATPATAGTPAMTTTQTEVSEGKEFGNPGVINFGAATGFNFKSESIKPAAGGDSNSLTTFQLDPQIQYFVAEGISVGGELLFDYSKPKTGDSTTAYGIGPSAGYNLWLTPGKLSLWPQLELLYKSGGSNLTVGTQSVSVTASQITLGVFVPLLIHPVKHFHFGVGPYFATDLSSKMSANGTSVDGDKTTVFGLKMEIAGWL